MDYAAAPVHRGQNTPQSGPAKPSMRHDVLVTYQVRAATHMAAPRARFHGDDATDERRNAHSAPCVSRGCAYTAVAGFQVHGHWPLDASAPARRREARSAAALGVRWSGAGCAR